MMDPLCRNEIAAFVRAEERPTVSRLLEADRGASLTAKLLEQLTRIDVQTKVSGVGRVSFTALGGEALMTAVLLDSGWSVSGPSASALQQFLRAIRVHEVESFEWVYLPPDLRTAMLDAVADDAQATPEKFRALVSQWASA